MVGPKERKSKRGRFEQAREMGFRLRERERERERVRERERE